MFIKIETNNFIMSKDQHIFNDYNYIFKEKFQFIKSMFILIIILLKLTNLK